MAEADWATATRKLLSYLEQQAPRVSFFQALALLERVLPDSQPLGHEGPASREKIRIRPSLALHSPTSDLEAIDLPQRAGEAVTVTATFLGLYGVDSPLPPAYGEHIAQLQDEPASARIRGFLDIFHHRLYALLYRAWRRSRPIANAQGHDPLFDRLLALIGYSARLGLGGTMQPKLIEARLKVLRARTAAGLADFLQLRLALAVRVEQLRSRWVEVPLDQQTRLGLAGCELGTTVVLGRQVADCGRMRLQVEVQDHSTWVAMALRGPLRVQLDRAVSDYLLNPVDYDVRVAMAADHVPALRLGSRTVALGRDMWLGRPAVQASWVWPGRSAMEPEARGEGCQLPMV